MNKLIKNKINKINKTFIINKLLNNESYKSKMNNMIKT